MMPRRARAGVLALTMLATMAVPGAARADAPPEVIPPGAIVDEFAGAGLGPDWQVVNNVPDRYSTTERPGFLRVHSLTGDTYQEINSARNLILRDIPRGDFQIVAGFETTVNLDYQNAGVLAWQDADNHLRVGLANVGFAGGTVIENALEVNGVFRSNLIPRTGVTAEILKVERVGDVFTTSYWAEGAWVQAAQVTAALDITRVGLYALSAQNGTPIVADFDFFAVLPPEGEPVVPSGQFSVDGGARGPFLTAGRDGVVTASPHRSAIQLRLRADGNQLRDDGGQYLNVRRDGTVVLGSTAAVSGWVLRDVGGDKVRLETGDGRFVTVHRGRLRAGADSAPKWWIRPYTATPGQLDVDADAAGTPMSQRLYGIFYEDINQAADGGLYAELVRNRSFEFNTVDNPSYTALTGWTAESATVATESPLNANNLNYLRLGGPGTVSNAGYNKGIAVDRGARYDFSVWARATAPTTLTVTIENGQTVLARTKVALQPGGWTKYSRRIWASGTTDSGRLVVTADAAVDLDMVSLFPVDTFKGRPNGMRKDLADKVAELKPSFLRFPGGCVTNVGNYEPFPDRRRIYRWKETIGPVEQRPTNFNFWGYNQSYGIGYFEYFQFAEDLGAEALPVVSVGVNGCNENRPLAEDQLGPWVQDTLDLIEFANGPVTSEWGAVRARLGHPKPFGLEYIGLGNEEIYPEFYRNYPHFARAIEAAYPDIKIITNSGQTSAGTIFDRGWEFAREQGADLVDEHYYNNPAWFLANNRRYDTYDRNGPKVFLGEYASRGNTFGNALSEASFMTGLERNADVVELASYAPLLANVDYVDWTPDLIWFDNDEVFGSASYHVQKMFSDNRGRRALPSTFTGGDPMLVPDIAGGIGLATWNTQAVYDNVKVTDADGTVLLGDDFSAGAGNWTPQTGTWEVVDGAYVQSSTATDARSTAGAMDWSNYTLEVDARKTGGAEGFLVMFGVQDTGNYYWWNLGGWGNTTSAVEKSIGGAKSSLATSSHTVAADRQYTIKIQVQGRRITTWLDGVKVNDIEDTLGRVDPLYQVVTRDARGDTVLKVVNARDTAVRTAVRLDDVRVGPWAEVTSLTADSPDDLSSLAEPDKVAPVVLRQNGFGRSFTYDFPAHSVTFIKLGR